MSRILQLTLLLTACALAYNHPEIKWKSVRTRHFTISYSESTEPAVYPVAKIAEEVYASMSTLYDFAPEQSIAISLADYDDFSNGFANWTNGSIQIWVPDLRFELRGNTVWLRNVLIHELAHIITMTKRPPANLLAASFGIQYSNPTTSLTLQSPLPLTGFYPHWFSEGIAQRESERAGGDCWDSRRDMILRCALLEGKQLSLEEMAHFNHDGIGNEMVYNHGYSLVSYIEERFGVESIVRLWEKRRHFTVGGVPFNNAFREVTGTPLNQVYREWTESMLRRYEQEKRSAPSSAQTLWSRGRFNALPRSSPDGRTWGILSSDGDDFGRTDLIIMKKGSSEILARIKHARVAWDYSTDGASVYYVKARDPNRHGSFLNDVYRYDLASGQENRVTNGARIYDLALLPDNNFLCVRFDKGLYSLQRYDSKSGSYMKLLETPLGVSFAGMSSSPDAEFAVISLLRNGNADLLRLRLSDGQMDTVVHTGAQEESPFWGKDGRIYFSADHEGVFDIFSVLPDGSDLRRHTTVQGGAFEPRSDGDGNLLFSVYTHRGFSIASAAAAGDSYSPGDSVPSTLLSLPAPRKVSLNPKPYEPVLRRPIRELSANLLINDQEASSSFSASRSVGFSAQYVSTRSDALEKRARQVALFAGMSQHNLERNSPGVNLKIGSLGFSDGNSSRLLASHRDSTNGSLHLYGQSRAQTSAESNSEDIPQFSQVSAGGGIGMENRVHTPTIGLQMQGMISEFGLIGMVTPSLGLQLHRDWEAGVLIQSLIYNFIPLGAQIPFWIGYSNIGYVNEDVNYNLGDYGQFEFMVSPSLLPMPVLREYDYRTDTTYVHVTGFSLATAGLRGFPLSRYSSLIIDASAAYSHFRMPVLDPRNRLEGISKAFLQLHGGARYVFPLIRNVNRGRFLYADALYGSVYYDVVHYADQHGLSRDFWQSFAEPEIDPDHLLVQHVVGAGIEMGVTRHSVFSRRLFINAAYDIYYEKVFIAAVLTY